MKRTICMIPRFKLARPLWMAALFCGSSLCSGNPYQEGKHLTPAQPGEDVRRELYLSLFNCLVLPQDRTPDVEVDGSVFFGNYHITPTGIVKPVGLLRHTVGAAAALDQVLNRGDEAVGGAIDMSLTSFLRFYKPEGYAYPISELLRNNEENRVAWPDQEIYDIQSPTGVMGSNTLEVPSALTYWMSRVTQLEKEKTLSLYYWIHERYGLPKDIIHLICDFSRLPCLEPQADRCAIASMALEIGLD